MQVLHDPLGLDDPPLGSVLSIGNFDGLHRGHQEILGRARVRADELGAPAAALLFDPHPVKVLRPREAPRLLTTLGQRLQLLERCGLDAALVLPFDVPLSRMGAEEFVRLVLVDRLRVREVLIGENFRFGADRSGDVEALRRLGAELGFAADGVAPVVVEGETVSSTRIRGLVEEGRIADASSLLGRPPFVDGRVFTGERMGRTLGFPTLNIAVANELFPAHGVYVTAVHIPSFGRTFASVTNIGVRPTVYENYATTVESHLFDFTADVYREDVRLFFLRRLRDEMIFPSTVHLVQQIRRDVETARELFAERPVTDWPLVEP